MTKPAKQISMCRSCGASIIFLRTSSGKLMPIDAATVSPGDEHFDARRGHVSHFSTCAQADEWRREAKGG